MLYEARRAGKLVNNFLEDRLISQVTVIVGQDKNEQGYQHLKPNFDALQTEDTG